jgi:quinol monooxygenase YgiN
MILMRGTLSIKPKMRARALVGIRKVMHASAEEAGVIAYQMSVDVDNPDKLYFMEVYQDEASLNAHAKSAHARDFMASTMPLMDLSEAILLIGEMLPYKLQTS